VHKSILEEAEKKPNVFKRNEDDYYLRDPATNKEVVSPLKFIDDNIKIEHLE